MATDPKKMREADPNQIREVVIPPTVDLPQPRGPFRWAAELMGWGDKKIPPPQHGPDKFDEMNMYDKFGQTYDRYLNYMTLPADRLALYNLYEDIADVAEIGSVLDGYAEDATQFEQMQQRTVWCEADDDEIVEEVHHLFDVIGVEEWIEGLAHDTAQYGDDFCRLHYDEKIPQKGILGVEWLDPREVERVEDPYGNLIGFAQLQTQQSIGMKTSVNDEDLWMPYDVVHFRLLSQKFMRFRGGVEQRYGETAMYGTSLLWNVRRVGKQVRLLEELLIIYRLSKAVDRFIYYVDVGKGGSPAQQQRTLNDWRRAMKKREYKNPTTGEFDVLYHAAALDDDIYWALHGDVQNSRVEVRPAVGNVTDAVDYDAFINKLFAGLRAPKAYFGYEGDVNAKATLSSQDIRFARGVKKIQRSIINGLTRIAQIHLIFKKGLKPEDVERVFTLRMVDPSQLELIQRLEADQVKLDIAARYLEFGETAGLNKVAWVIHVLQNVLNMSNDDIQRFASDILKDGGDDLVGTSFGPPGTLGSRPSLGGEDEFEFPTDLSGEEVPPEDELPTAPEAAPGAEQAGNQNGRKLIMELANRLALPTSPQIVENKAAQKKTLQGEVSSRRKRMNEKMFSTNLQRLAKQLQGGEISRGKFDREASDLIRVQLLRGVDEPEVPLKQAARKRSEEEAEQLRISVEKAHGSTQKLSAVFANYSLDPLDTEK